MRDKQSSDAKFGADKFATDAAGIVIDAAHPGYARCTMQISPRHLNAGGVVMGGAIFTLADFASAVATNRESENTVTLSATIEYLRAGTGAYLTAEAVMRKEGRICFYEVTVTNDKGCVVAKTSGNAYRME